MSGKPIEIARRDLIAAGKRPTSRWISKGWSATAARTWARPRGAARAAGRSRSRRRAAHSSGVFTRRQRLWRDLRAGADPRLLPPRAARGQAHLQRRADRRRDDAPISTRAGSGSKRPARQTSSPPIAVARGDLRAMSQEQIERTSAKMRAIVAQSLPGSPGDHQLRQRWLSADAADGGNRAILEQAEPGQSRRGACRSWRSSTR